MNTKTVGERIAQARKQRKLTQGDLAAAAGFATQSGIGNLENRKDGRGGFSIGKIAAALNVPVAWLLDGPDSEVVPFVDAAGQVGMFSPRADSPATLPYTDTERAVALLKRLPNKAVKEALLHLEYLTVKYNTPSTDGADFHVSAPASKTG